MNILIIGCGNLGKRYIQAIDKIKHNIKIILVDPFLDITTINIKNHKYEVYKDVLKIKDSIIFLTIISTCSDIRFEVTTKAINFLAIKNIIFEKFLFQKEKEYYLIQTLLNKNKINSWVNTPRGTYDFYKQLKNKINNKQITMTVSGSSWGLACNAIHFIDLYCYLNDSYDIKFKSDNLKVIKAKRKGFYEIIGKISSIENSLIIECNNNKEFKLTKVFKNNNTDITIENKNGNLYFNEKIYKIPYLSEYMYNIILQLIENKTCNLTPYEKSIKIHISLLKIFKNIFKKNNIDNCPIT